MTETRYRLYLSPVTRGFMFAGAVAGGAWALNNSLDYSQERFRSNTETLFCATAALYLGMTCGAALGFLWPVSLPVLAYTAWERRALCSKEDFAH